MNILMLEDDPAIAQGLRYSLESEGYTVTHCATVARALEAVGAGRFDLCLLDLTLPDGSGYDVCKAINAKDDTPVIRPQLIPATGALMGTPAAIRDRVEPQMEP